MENIEFICTLALVLFPSCQRVLVNMNVYLPFCLLGVLIKVHDFYSVFFITQCISPLMKDCEKYTDVNVNLISKYLKNKAAS